MIGLEDKASYTKLHPGDVFTCATPEEALKFMEKLAENKIYCILHNYWCGHHNTAVEVKKIYAQ